MPKAFKLTVGSHFFKLTDLSRLGSDIAMSFAKRFVQHGAVRLPGGRYHREQLRVFAAATKKRDEFRFHIHTLKEFFSLLESYNLTSSEYVREDLVPPSGLDIEVDLKSEWQLRDYQEPIVEYLTSPVTPQNNSKFLGLATGQGKTLCALYALSKINKRFIAVIKPMYLAKWTSDIKKIYNCSKEDIVVVQGSSHLLALLVLAEQNKLTAKFILISNRTMQNWVKLYEEFGAELKDIGYPCSPDEFCTFINAGVRLIDEVHQDFHFNYKLDLYTNVAKTISLSATLINKDPFLVRMYEIAYPVLTRYSAPAPPKYNHAIALQYNFQARKVGHIRSSEWGSSSYSHIAFEKWLMRDRETLENYSKMITDVLAESHFKDYKPGQKTLILCGSIAFCTYLTDYLKKKFPQSDTRRFVESDPLENLLESEISVSTQLSAGTAHDIPMLRSVIMTTAIDSYQANIQALGRLRQMDFPTRFYYFVCTSIDKHIKYHKAKKELFKDRVATQIEIGYPKEL